MPAQVILLFGSIFVLVLIAGSLLLWRQRRSPVTLKALEILKDDAHVFLTYPLLFYQSLSFAAAIWGFGNAPTVIEVPSGPDWQYHLFLIATIVGLLILPTLGLALAFCVGRFRKARPIMLIDGAFCVLLVLMFG
jgi:hypothetical protein